MGRGNARRVKPSVTPSVRCIIGNHGQHRAHAGRRGVGAGRGRPSCSLPRPGRGVRRQSAGHHRTDRRAGRPPFRLPHDAPRDHALVGRRRRPDRRADAGGGRRHDVVGQTPRARRAVVAVDPRAHRRDRLESSGDGLAGLVRPAAVPAVERPVVLRRLGRDRRSLLLAGTARGPGVGRATAPGQAALLRDRPRRVQRGGTLVR